MSHKRAIIVLGMHRSGTSAMTRALNLMGVPLGPSVDAWADSEAPFYWENLDVVALHDRLLGSMNASWESVRMFADETWTKSEVASSRTAIHDLIAREYGELPLWAIKEPRMCRTLPLWTEALQLAGVRPSFILVVRDPHEVAGSLLDRNQLPAAQSQLMWLAHNLDAVHFSDSYPRVIVDYANLLAQPRTELSRIVETLQLDLPAERGNAARPSSQDGIDAAANFLQPRMNHQGSVAREEQGEYCAPHVSETYSLLKDLSRNDVGAAAKLKALRVCWTQEYHTCAPLLDHLLNAAHKGEKHKHQAEIAQNRIDSVLNSNSWRIVAPLRNLRPTLEAARHGLLMAPCRPRLLPTLTARVSGKRVQIGHRRGEILLDTRHWTPRGRVLIRFEQRDSPRNLQVALKVCSDAIEHHFPLSAVGSGKSRTVVVLPESADSMMLEFTGGPGEVVVEHLSLQRTFARS